MSSENETPKRERPPGSRRKESQWTAEERAAIQERARELRTTGKIDGETAVRAAIAAMPESDRSIAQRVHNIVRAVAPSLTPRTWYGMPAYAVAGKVLCYFTPASKFQTRYATFGFTDAARLDDGNLWPVAFALKDLTPAEEAKIVELLTKAIG